MDFRDTPEEAAFRDELRAWLAANVPDDVREAGISLRTDDLAALRAWLAANVPDEVREAGISLRTDDLDAMRAWSRALHEEG